MQVLSIGTGLGDVVMIHDRRTSIISALKKMASSSRQVAARLEEKYDVRNYQRFNVERGLEDVTLSDWDKASKISAHTHNYLQESRQRLENFVKTFAADVVPAEEVPRGQPQTVTGQ